MKNIHFLLIDLKDENRFFNNERIHCSLMAAVSYDYSFSVYLRKNTHKNNENNGYLRFSRVI